MTQYSGTDNPVVVIDSSGLIAQLSEKGAFYDIAGEVADFIERNQYRLVFPATTIAESISTLIWDKRRADARILLDTLLSSPIAIIPITHEILQTAALLYEEKEVGRKDSFFDVIVVAVAKQLNTKLIFGFDPYFKKLGFVLMEEHIKTLTHLDPSPPDGGSG